MDIVDIFYMYFKKKDRTKLRIFCSFFLNKSFLCWNLHPENVLIFQNAKTKELANFEGIGLSALEEQQEKTKDRRTHVDMVYANKIVYIRLRLINLDLFEIGNYVLEVNLEEIMLC